METQKQHFKSGEDPHTAHSWQWRRRVARLMAVSLLAALLIFALVRQGDALRAAENAPSGDLQIGTLVTIVFPTPTRTPSPVNIGNFVWDDMDGDGRQDAGEPGLSGITVQLWNSTKSQVLSSDVTDANGIYTVVAPTPGNYYVRVIPGVGDTFTLKDAAGGDETKDSDINNTGSNYGFTDLINIASNVISITSIDAGILKFRTATPTRTPTPVNIGNFIWNDLNENGIQDAGEPGLNGITVQLWNPAMNLMIDSATTNTNGNYTVVAPTPGNYRLRVIVPVGAGITLKDQGGDDTKDSDFNSASPFGFTDIFNIASNVISTTIYDGGLINVPATPTYTNTPLVTNTFTPSKTPTPDNLVTGTATPGTTATPTLAAGIDLLVNGDFDLLDENNSPEIAPWVVKNGTGDKIKCNKDKTGDGDTDDPEDKIVAYSGNCAFNFKGGVLENAKLAQNIVLTDFSFTNGDLLQFSLYVWGKGEAVSGKVKIKVKYTDTTLATGKLTITLVPTNGYQVFAESVVLQSGDLSAIKVQVSHKSTSGKVLLDALVLRQIAAARTLPLPLP